MTSFHQTIRKKKKKICKSRIYCSAVILDCSTFHTSVPNKVAVSVVLELHTQTQTSTANL